MPNWRDIVYGLYGAWRLARLDRAGLGFFDATVAGFWKSFFASVLVAPAYVILVVIDLTERGTEAGFGRILLVHLIAYVLSWTAFPLITYHICDSIGKLEAYVGYIVAFNWAVVLQTAAFLPVALIAETGVLPVQVMSLAVGLAYVVILGYEWFVTRVALGVSGGPAFGFVGLDLVVSLAINAAARSMVA